MELEATVTSPLGAIHGGVGTRDQQRGLLAIVRVDRDAHAHGNLQPFLAHRARLADRKQQLLRGAGRVGRLGDIGQPESTQGRALPIPR